MSNRNIVIDRCFQSVVIVASRYATTANELASELGICRRQAARYLDAMSKSLPIVVREENLHETNAGARPTHYYSFDTRWRKKHGFL